MVTRQVIAMLVLASSLLVTPQIVLAQDATELSETERSELGRLFSDARKAYEAQDFETSIQKLMAAYEIFPEPNMLYRIGEMHETLENRGMAAEYYERYLTENPEDDDRALIESRIARLRRPQVREAEVPSRLTIVTRPGEAEVYLVGESEELLGTSPLEVELEPGVHSIRVAKEGYEPLTKRFEIGASELRTSELMLSEVDPPAQPLSLPQTSVAPIVLAFSSFAVAGGAVAMLVISGAKQDQLDEWDAERGDMMRPPEYDDTLDDELTFRVIGWSLVGVSASLAAASFIWWLNDDEEYSLRLAPGSVNFAARF